MIKSLLSALSLVLFTTICCAEDSPHIYNVSGKGELHYLLPPGWVEQTTDPGTLVLTDPGRKSFTLLVGFAPERLAPESLQGQVQIISKTVGGHKVVRFQGIVGPGYFYTATDPSVPKGKLKYMTQGLLDLGRTTATFVLMSSSKNGDAQTATLRLLSNAVFVGASAP